MADEEAMALSRLPGEDEIYIGGILTLKRKASLERTGITHIVSILKFRWQDYDDCEKYGHLDIAVDDLEHENLLVEFERCGAFIEDALRNGKDGRKGSVLIHCAMGKSRSATICIAYLLRRYSTQYTVSSALALLRTCRPMAEPNTEFMAQLELYHKMKCPVDVEEHPVYQRWLYRRQVADALAAGVAPETVRFEDEVDRRREDGNDVTKDGGDSEMELRCRICRKTLATSQYIITHTTPANEPASKTSPYRRSKFTTTTTTASSSDPHTHFFLQPLSWMRPVLTQGLLSGRLECPNAKCAAQIGRYAWQGLPCSCGEWICPAFSLGKARVDAAVVGRRRRAEVGQEASPSTLSDAVADVTGNDTKSERRSSNSHTPPINGGTSGGGGKAMGIRYPPGMRPAGLEIP